LPSDDSTKKRQSDANRGGAKFELYVKNSLNENLELQRQKIRIFDGKEIINDPGLFNQIAIPLRGYQPTGRDIDLVAVDLEKRKAIALICCTLSLHGRLPETLFYSLLYKKIKPSLKVILATPDKGKQKSSSTWKSEWGTKKEPLKSRALAEKFLHGVYVDNAYLNNQLHLSGTTAIGGKIKPFSKLIVDLVSWKNS